MKNYLSILVLFFFASASLFAQKEDVQFGKASFYSDKFHGKPTASGELYDKNKMTAAHRTLPYGTILKVTRTDNNKSVRVRVNDRGPFIPGRIVDVSRAAAERLGMINSGEVDVKVEIVREGTEDKAVTATKPKKETPKALEAPSPQTPTKKTTPPKTSVADNAKTKQTDKADAKKDKPAKEASGQEKPKKETPKIVVADKAKTTAKGKLVTTQNFQPYGLYKIELRMPEQSGFGVQVGVFTQVEGALKEIANLQGQWFDNILLNIEKAETGETVYKIILGPFENQDSANAYKTALKKKKINGFVVPLSAAK